MYIRLLEVDKIEFSLFKNIQVNTRRDDTSLREARGVLNDILVRIPYQYLMVVHPFVVWQPPIKITKMKSAVAAAVLFLGKYKHAIRHYMMKMVRNSHKAGNKQGF